MKYMIETTENGCLETITFSDGRQYSKRYEKMEYDSRADHRKFCEQMKRDGIRREILDKLDDLCDGFIANDIMRIAELDHRESGRHSDNMKITEQAKQLKEGRKEE